MCVNGLTNSFVYMEHRTLVHVADVSLSQCIFQWIALHAVDRHRALSTVSCSVGGTGHGVCEALWSWVFVV